MTRSTSIVLRLLAGLVLAFGLAACGTSGDGTNGGDGNGDGNGGDARQVGFLSASETTTASDTSTQQTSEIAGFGGFVEAEGDASVPDAFLADPWNEVRNTCQVTGIVDTDPLGQLPLPDVDVNFLDAGQQIDVTTSGRASAVLTLDRQEVTFGGETIVAYNSGGAISGTLPTDLSADIPGAEFPEVNDAEFPSVGAFTLTSPVNPGVAGSVDATTVFQWSDPSAEADTIVTISFSTGSLQNPQFVTCFADDDGSFAIPEDTQAELGGSFTGAVSAASRNALRVQSEGDARIILSTSRGESFPFQGVPKLP